MAHQAEVIFDTPTKTDSFLDFFRTTIPSYFRMLIRMIREIFGDLIKR